MKITFKDFHNVNLNEVLKVDDNNNVVYTMQSSKFGSSKTEIDTYDKAPWYSEHSDSKTGGIDVYSAYLYKHSEMVTNILHALKGEGPYKVADATRQKLLKATAKRTAALVLQKKVDTIIFPKSSSPFLKEFVGYVKQELGSADVTVMDEAIIKKQIDAISVEKKDFSELIDFENPKFNTLKPATIKALEKQIETSIKANAEKGKGNTISMKDIYKGQAKFVKDFLEIVKDLSEMLHDKNVMLVDDVLSSGATFSEMVRLVQKEKVKSLVGLTIFKLTGTGAKKDE